MATIGKRLVILCDGTWQNGLATIAPTYTNVFRIARAINKVDTRGAVPIHQIVYYSSGVGTEKNLSAIGEAATGSGLIQKVQEAYGFIVQNWSPGDEIFFYGFSRGAYTVRMVAGIIGSIGILCRSDMEHFVNIFAALQKKRSNDPTVNNENSATLNRVIENAKIQIKSLNYPFIIKAVCCFDTVGAMGLPDEVRITTPAALDLFGFSDTKLGEHIQVAYHALALNETRADFLPTKWNQTKAGLAKGQLLKQVWFAGCHSDIGGGFPDHDLSDFSLYWMISSTSNLISYDDNFIKTLSSPVSLWGEQKPHNPLTGIFTFADRVTRVAPAFNLTSTSDTNESYHSSVSHQSILPSNVSSAMKNSSMVEPLLKFEEQMKLNWIFPSVNSSSNSSKSILIQKKENPLQVFEEFIADKIKGLRL